MSDLTFLLHVCQCPWKMWVAFKIFLGYPKKISIVNKF
jgi:hypothetical protein